MSMLSAFPGRAGTKDLLLEAWVGMTSRRFLGKGVFYCPEEKVQAREERGPFPVLGWWDRKFKPPCFAEGSKSEPSVRPRSSLAICRSQLAASLHPRTGCPHPFRCPLSIVLNFWPWCLGKTLPTPAKLYHCKNRHVLDFPASSLTVGPMSFWPSVPSTNHNIGPQ